MLTLIPGNSVQRVSRFRGISFSFSTPATSILLP